MTEVRSTQDGIDRREFLALSGVPLLGAILTTPGQLPGEQNMLKGKLIHPQILEALGRAGHGSQILIADGNYPAGTKLGPKATLVNLNLSPGLVNCTQVLEALVSAVVVESAAVMAGSPTPPEIWNEFRAILQKAIGQAPKLEEIERFKFYEIAGSPDVALTIATGEQRIYANLLLTIGVVPPK